MLRMKLLAVVLASTVALPTLAAADPSHDKDWRGPDAERYERRAYDEGWRDAIREARRDDRWRDRRSDRWRGDRRYDHDRRYDDDDWRRGRDDFSPADIIIPLLNR